MKFEEVKDLAVKMGPLVSICTVSSDGTPHIVPVVAVWDEDVLMCGSRISSMKARHLRAHAATAVQVVTLGSSFPDALLLKGTSELVEDPARKQHFWDSGLFPFLPQIYATWEDPELCFVRFTPTRAFFSPEGGQGGLRAWRAAERATTATVHPGG